MKQVVLIMLLCILVVLGYGILHNQITTRINLEYFTIGHHKIINSTSPTALGIAWGFYSNWWIGLSFGVLLSLASRAGNWTKRAAVTLVKPVCLVAVFSALAAGVAGFLGYKLTGNGVLGLSVPLSLSIPVSERASYIAALWMHTASYFAGVAGSMILVLLVFLRRIRELST